MAASIARLSFATGGGGVGPLRWRVGSLRRPRSGDRGASCTRRASCEATCAALAAVHVRPQVRVMTDVPMQLGTADVGHAHVVLHCAVHQYGRALLWTPCVCGVRVLQSQCRMCVWDCGCEMEHRVASRRYRYVR